MAGRITKDFRKNVRADIQTGMIRNLENAAFYLERKVGKDISVDGTGVGANGNLIYNANPSSPGEPPHAQHGGLRASISHDINISNLTARVGTNLKYGMWLELGTRNMAARPYLRTALNDARAILARILSKKIH